ncbi:MAG: dicarboxylate/amino acid:cation symporter [Elusimicrobia bacterium]|nr:dicarboxylate/amino acid:cation symporter [Elusimicrobiota bacterium]
MPATSRMGTNAPLELGVPAGRKTKKQKSIPMSMQIMAAMAAGSLLGLALGPQASPLGELGKIVIQLIKAAATPLLFFAIVNAVLKADVNLKSGAKMAGIALINASIALGIGLALSNLLQPGRHLASIAAASTGLPANGAIVNQKIDIWKTISSYIPANFIQPFAENAVIPIIIIALLLGFGLRRLRSEEKGFGENFHQMIENSMAALQRLMEIILGWIILLAPMAVFGVVAKAVGQYGFAPFKGLGVYVGVALLGLTLHSLSTYQLWISLYARMNLRRFWQTVKEPAIYSFGANSSLATLPLTLKALDSLGVNKASSALGACVGTNLNNDGIILYEAMAALFIAQAHGLDLGLGQQLVMAFFCLIAAMGVAGVPEAGFVSLSLVLVTVGLPTELLPLILTVDWIIARARSVVNVLSDMVVSISLDGPRPLRTARLEI